MAVHSSPWDTPDLVGAALRESLRIGYLESTRSETGRFLATLAASCRGTIADLGTGCGVGTAWLRTGAPGATRVVTVERDPELARTAERLFHDTGVEVVAGDWSTIDWPARDVECFSMVTIDAATAGGASDRLVDLVCPGGFLVLDDPHGAGDFAEARAETLVLQSWMHDDRLWCTEVHLASDASVLLCTRR